MILHFLFVIAFNFLYVTEFDFTKKLLKDKETERFRKKREKRERGLDGKI
jgi:hypothetical protein